MMTKIRDLMARREAGEKGFTLIELLVVIIIIGILAAVAIPIFMNQQKSAIDSATQSDVRNVATNIETLRVKNPTASGADIDLLANSGDTVTAQVGTGNQAEVSLSDGTQVEAYGGPTAADGFIVVGYNTNGNQAGGTPPALPADYTAAKALVTSGTSDYVVYDSAAGGLQ